MARHGDARRDQLVTAAVTALSERGIVDLRIKDVADAAGVSTGTVHYHFKDLDELLIAIHETAIDRFANGRRELLSTLPDARDKLLALADTGVPASRDDELVVALYDIAALFRRSAIHRALIRSLYEQQVAMYAATFEIGVAQGHFRFDGPLADLAANAVALEDAYGLHIVTRNGAVTPERARRLIREHLAAVSHCPELAVSITDEEDAL